MAIHIGPHYVMCGARANGPRSPYFWLTEESTTKTMSTAHKSQINAKRSYYADTDPDVIIEDYFHAVAQRKERSKHVYDGASDYTLADHIATIEPTDDEHWRIIAYRILIARKDVLTPDEYADHIRLDQRARLIKDLLREYLPPIDKRELTRIHTLVYALRHPVRGVGIGNDDVDMDA